ncbi:MAG TPA: glucosamine-6-phosphate deaminase [Pyrinomonadaceae bacterium]|jgi:glucosamine-6-phosphate deaminase|nr:glucosamine-6-phosphate deaminase [Pyrinomonadaceae bacterium]
MQIRVFDTKLELGEAAARDAAKIINQAIDERDVAYVIAATGASQFEFLDALAKQEIDWTKVVFFHLDEYVGLPESHLASFRRYLKERVVSRLHPQTFHFLNGEAVDVAQECRRVGDLIAQQTIDVAFVGIGENGHLAFNDPPADFDTEDPYLVVNLDDACRRQQVGEGWFKSIAEVPTQAISMSIKQILKSRNILCIVPDERKAEAVKATVKLEVSPMRPASILQQHARVTLYLDHESSSLLNQAAR